MLEDGSVAVVAHRFEGQVGQLVRFKLAGGTLTEHTISGPALGGSTFPRLLSNTLAGGGVSWTDMEGGFGAEVAPGFLAGWNIAEPRLEVRASTSPATVAWAYQRGNAQGQNYQINPLLGTFFKTHNVENLEDYGHIALWIVPIEQAYWRDRRPDVFNQILPGSTGLYFGTLGGKPSVEGPTSCASAYLWAAFNEIRDVTRPPARPLEALNIVARGERANIERLLQLQTNYIARQATNLDYECYPAHFTDGYNSNSYLRGLVEAAGFNKYPAFPFQDIYFRGNISKYPGWFKPVPKVNFDPVQ